MSTITRKHRRYDHRLREFVQSTGNIDVAVQRGVPRSTAYGWLSKSPAEVITLDVLDTDARQLRHEVVALRRRNATAHCAAPADCDCFESHGLLALRSPRSRRVCETATTACDRTITRRISNSTQWFA